MYCLYYVYVYMCAYVRMNADSEEENIDTTNKMTVCMHDLCMYVCMYVYVYASMYVRMHACVCALVYAHISTCVDTNILTLTQKCIHAYLSIHKHIDTYIYTHLYKTISSDEVPLFFKISSCTEQQY
jgi:hypothetical protein